MAIGDTFQPSGGIPSLTAGEVISLYNKYLFRNPDPSELASELDNANRYSAAGIEATIANRAGPVGTIQQPTGLTIVPRAVDRDVAVLPLPVTDINDRDMLASSDGGSLGESLTSPIGTEGFGDFIRGVIGLIPGVGPVLSPILGTLPSLPKPPTRTPPMLPPGGGFPPEVGITIPRPRGGIRAPSGKTIASIGAIAAALGITVEEYIRRYGLPKHRRHMNILNPRALRRSTRRVFGFERFARRMLVATHRSHMKGLHHAKKRH